MKTKLTTLTIAVLLAACGGGGGGTPATTFTVIDGLLKGALVCVDANHNSICEANETQGTTDVLGVVSLNVPAADAGKYPTLVIVPMGAVDADDPANPIAIAYKLKAPASNPTVITPLTTLVQHLVESGQTSTEAAESVAKQTDVPNVFANFIATPDANARTVAKTIVKLVQNKTTELARFVGKMDSVTGLEFSQVDIDKAIHAAIVTSLPKIVKSVSALGKADGTCAKPTSAECKTAISTAVGTVSSDLPVPPLSKVCSDAGLAASNGSALPTVCMMTSLGELVIELENVKAPITTDNFLKYVKDGFYSNTVFHRVISTFMVQSGGFTYAPGTNQFSAKTAKYPAIKLEVSSSTGLRNTAKTITMARTDVLDSATSEFFINVVDNPFLDTGYAVFGRLIYGDATLAALKSVAVVSNGRGEVSQPTLPPVILRAVRLR